MEDEIAALRSVLGEDNITPEQAENLLKYTARDLDAAVSLFFDRGSEALFLQGNSQRLEVDSQPLEQPLEQEEAAAGDAAYENGDQGPIDFTEVQDSLEHLNMDHNAMERSRRRRPGTAPPNRSIGQAQLDLDKKFDAMRSVVGLDVPDEVLEQLLRNAGGNVQMALETFFESESKDFVMINSYDGAGIPLPSEDLGIGTSASGHHQASDDSDNTPRKPYESLAALIGSGVNPHILAILMVETQGEVEKALEKYSEARTNPAILKEVEKFEKVVTAEQYYLRPEEAVPVYCNVYDLAWGQDDKDGKKKKVNSGLPGMGFGIYHSGIEVYGREISFGYSDDGCTGVFEVPSRCAGGVMPRITFKEAITMGYINRSRHEVDHLLSRLAEKYRGDTYDLVRRNCNHFSNELCVCLTGKKIPAYINRPANVGRVAMKLFSVPAVAFGKLVDGVKKVQKKESDGAAKRVVEAPNASRIAAGASDSPAENPQLQALGRVSDSPDEERRSSPRLTLL